MKKPVKITLYRWAGSWGPFKVNIPCGECTLTKDILKDTFSENELADVDVELEVKDWLSHWWEPLKPGSWHAPILVVEGKVVSQGEALNRGVSSISIIKRVDETRQPERQHCLRESMYPFILRQSKENAWWSEVWKYQYHDVVKDSAALYRMIPSKRTLVLEKTPVTVPQIWLDGKYIGRAR